VTAFDACGMVSVLVFPFATTTTPEVPGSAEYVVPDIVTAEPPAETVCEPAAYALTPESCDIDPPPFDHGTMVVVEPLAAAATPEVPRKAEYVVPDTVTALPPAENVFEPTT